MRLLLKIFLPLVGQPTLVNTSFAHQEKFNKDQACNKTTDVGAVGHPASRIAAQHAYRADQLKRKPNPYGQ